MHNLFEPETPPFGMRRPPLVPVPRVDAMLRPWNRTDAPELCAVLADPEIHFWNGLGLDSSADAIAWVDNWAHRWRTGTGASWAVVRRTRPTTVLGQIAFRSLHLDAGLAEISYWIARRLRRRHLGTEATRALADWAFENTDLERLEIAHSVRNLPSCSVALRAGFQIEGIKRHLQRHPDGYHDMCSHSRIRADDGRPIEAGALARRSVD